MKFDSLKTQRLLIRRLSLLDAPAIAAYRNLPEVARFQSWESYSVAKATELVGQMSEADPSLKAQWFQFGIELISEKELIGDIGFLNTDKNGKSWLGFTLDSSFWNQGYASEAVGAVIGYYAELGISEIWASTDPENKSAAKLLGHLGFTLQESKPDDLILKKQ